MARRKARINRGLPEFCYREVKLKTLANGDQRAYAFVTVRIGKGRRIALRAEPGAPEFEFEYLAAVAELKAEIGRFGADPDSTRTVVADYLASPDFSRISAGAARKRRKALEKFAAANGERPFPLLGRKHLEDMIASFASPHGALLFWKAMRKLTRWAVEKGRIDADPMAKVPVPETPEAIAFARWYPEHIDAFRAKHGHGTIERRALELLIATAARGRSDVSRFKRTDIRDGVLTFTAEKNHETVSVVLPPAALHELALLPATELVLFRNKLGKPMTGKRFGEMFAAACEAAGLKGFSAHGLRHAAASEAAEGGGSEYEIMAMLGDRSPQAARIYVQQANVMRLNASAHAKRAKGGPT